MELKVFKYKEKEKEENGVFVNVVELMNVIDHLEMQTDMASVMWFNLKTDIINSYDVLMEEQKKDEPKEDKKE